MYNTNYKKFDKKDEEYLRSIFEEGYCFFGKEIGEDYGKDELGTCRHMPDALVFARSKPSGHLSQ